MSTDIAVSRWNDNTWDWEFIDDIPEDPGLAVAESTGEPAGLSYGTKRAATVPDKGPDLSDGLLILKPDPEPPTEKPDRAAYVECWLGGALVTTGHSKPGGKREQVGGGPRGSITRFSFASRRRLMRRLAQTKRNAVPMFVTVTYPDHFSSDPWAWKNDLKKFAKRLARKFPGASFVWRLHTLERKSGDNAGKIAPHFHLLVWGAGYTNLREFVPVAWFETVASNDPKHLRAGTRVEMPLSFKAVMRYVSNEIAKVEQSTPVDGIGRWWGFYGRKLVPWALRFRWPVSDQEVYQLMRWFRRFANLPARSYKSLSVFANADFWHSKIRAGPDPPMEFRMWSAQFS